jgi:hypothetical protein
MIDLSLTEACVVIAGAVALILSATHKALPITRRFLPLGGSDFAQVGILLMLAVGTSQLVGLLFPTKSVIEASSIDIDLDD